MGDFCCIGPAGLCVAGGVDIGVFVLELRKENRIFNDNEDDDDNFFL